MSTLYGGLLGRFVGNCHLPPPLSVRASSRVYLRGVCGSNRATTLWVCAILGECSRKHGMGVTDVAIPAGRTPLGRVRDGNAKRVGQWGPSLVQGGRDACAVAATNRDEGSKALGKNAPWTGSVPAPHPWASQ
jgi:hypothetical protein